MTMIICPSTMDKPMIICKKLNATIPESTCQARQRAVSKQMAERLKSKKNGNGPAWGYRGGDGAALQYVSCIGCQDFLPENKRKQPEKKKEGENLEEKTCTKCGIKKNIDLFYKQASMKDGHQAQCKKCFDLAVAFKKGIKPAIKSAEPKTESVEIPIITEPVIVPVSNTRKKRVCSRCKNEFPLTPEFFHRCATHVSGYREICKTCRSASRPDTKSEIRIVLNFEKDRELFEKVSEMAKKERRAIDQQILCVLEMVAI